MLRLSTASVCRCARHDRIAGYAKSRARKGGHERALVNKARIDIELAQTFKLHPGAHFLEESSMRSKQEKLRFLEIRMSFCTI